LVVRNDGIGDVVLTTPLLRALRDTFPEAWISLVVRPAVKELAELCPHVDEVLVFDRNPADKSDFRFVRRFWKALRLAARSLWKRNFDLAIVPRWGADHYYSSYIAYLSGAPRRVGYSESVTEYKLRFNRGYDLLFTDVLHDRQLKHELEHDLDIIAHLRGQSTANQPEVWFTNDDMMEAQRLLHSSGWD